MLSFLQCLAISLIMKALGGGDRMLSGLRTRSAGIFG